MNGSIGTAMSLILTAAGAVLAFALRVQAGDFNANVVGWILLEIGIAGLLVSLMIGSADRASGG